MIKTPELKPAFFTSKSLQEKKYLSTTTLILLTSVVISIFYNISLWKDFSGIINFHKPKDISFFVSQFLLVIAASNLVFSFFAFKYLLKPLLTISLLIAASCAYFMDNYGVIIDSSMIQNMFETDVHESLELMTPRFFFYLLLLGALPSWLLFKTPVRFKPLLPETATRVAVMAASLVIVLASAAIHYKDFSIVHRQHKELRMLVNPVYPAYAFVHYLIGESQQDGGAVKIIGGDAHQTAEYQQKPKKSVVIFVLGETARSMQFQLNGYARNTNPKLSTYPVINFPNTWSCGTATAESVPCMFSMLKREHYSASAAKTQESVLDVLQRAGVSVLWRDNNAGCKGTCLRVGSESMSAHRDAQFCNGPECLDEILLKGLQQKVDQSTGDLFIVLHQKGSHGPEYFRRSPENMKAFKPECNNANVMECSRESIINAYDNTILYTDFFLSRVIDFLQLNSEKYDTAMLYMSDHGESLGENGVYLHGFPYAIAPEEQRHIPFIAWISDAFANTNGINIACVRENAGAEYSHDDLFHTSLGLFNIQTAIYQPLHDVFKPCRTQR